MTVLVNPVNSSVFAGQLFSITCIITGADSLEARFNFDFIAEDNGTVIHQGNTSDTQLIHNFIARVSDAGKYVCKVKVCSDFLARPITSMSTAVTLTVQRKPNLFTVQICDMNLREEYLTCNKLTGVNILY